MEKIEKGRAKWTVFFFAALVLIMSIGLASAGEDPAQFPSKPITMLIPFPAGGSTDLAARSVAETASKELGQPIVLENRPGGAGMIAYSGVAKAPNDGYTIGTVSGAVVMVPLQRSVPFKTKEDFTWLINYMDYTFTLSVKADARWKTLKEFIEEARANPGKLSLAFMGTRGLMHLMAEQLALAADVKFKFVPTTGGAEAITYLLGGHVDSVMSGEVGHVRSGTIRPLAQLGDKRVKYLPDVPTFSELGYKIDCPTWLGFFAPKGVHPQIAQKLANALKKGAEAKPFSDMCDQLMAGSNYMDSETFTKFVMTSFDNQAIILKKIGFID